MPIYTYNCLPCILDHLIVNLIKYPLLHKSFSNDLNQGRKDQKNGQNDSGRNDPADTTKDRNDPDSRSRLKILDFISMGKKPLIVHRVSDLFVISSAVVGCQMVSFEKFNRLLQS